MSVAVRPDGTIATYEHMFAYATDGDSFLAPADQPTLLLDGHRSKLAQCVLRFPPASFLHLNRKL